MARRKLDLRVELFQRRRPHGTGDPVKVKTALQLREQTVTPLEWIGDWLPMKTQTYVNHVLYWDRKFIAPGS